MKHFRNSCLCVLLVLLLAAAALTGCAQTQLGEGQTTAASAGVAQSTTAAPAADSQTATDAPASVETTSEPIVAATQELGEGEKLFYFEVTFDSGSTASYVIHTDAATVGDALVELELISGEQGQYGLYVTEVAGETHDYNTDKCYWAFYVNGEYAMTGVDATEITEGATYAFIPAKD